MCKHTFICMHTYPLGVHQSTHECLQLMHACMHAHIGYPTATSPLLALLPSSLQRSGVASLQEISKETVYTTSSKEIIIIITLSDLAVKFLQKGWMSSRGGGWGCWTAGRRWPGSRGALPPFVLLISISPTPGNECSSFNDGQALSLVLDLLGGFC